MRSFTIRGIDIREGECYKFLIGRFFLYAKILTFTENPYIIVIMDIYGKKLAIDLRKTTIISEFDCLEFENRSQNKTFQKKERKRKAKKEQTEEQTEENKEGVNK